MLFVQIIVVFFIVIVLPLPSLAQDKGFAVSGQGREGGLIQPRINAIHRQISNLDEEQELLIGNLEEKNDYMTSCGDDGSLWGPGHVLANPSECIPSFVIMNDGNLSIDAGLQISFSTGCDPSQTGKIRYNSGNIRPEYCNGTDWVDDW